MADSRHLDAYKAFLDPGLSADEKKARIDSIYAQPDPAAIADVAPITMAAPAAGPDLRTADLGGQIVADPTGGGYQPPAGLPNTGSPAVSDVGAIQAGLKAAGANPIGAPSPARPSAGAPAPGATPMTEGAAVMPPTPEQLADADMTSLARSSMLRRGGTIKAADIPTASVVEGREETPEAAAAKRDLEGSQLAEGMMAVSAGDQQAKAAHAAGEAADQDVFNAEAERSKERFVQAAAQKHLATIEDDYQKTLKDSELQPNAWFANKSTGQKITSVLGAIMLGLGGHPEMVTKIIDDDMAQRNANRDKMLGGKRQQISTFQNQMLSPEARMTMDHAMSLDIAAAQARQLAAAAAEPEMKMRAMQAAQQLSTQSAAQRLAGAQQEEKTVRTNIVHRQAQSFGGGMTPENAAKTAKELYGNDPQGVRKVMIAAEGGAPGMALTPEQEKDALSRRVVVPGTHTVLWAPREADAQAAQAELLAANHVMQGYGKLQQIMKSAGAGRSLSPSEQGEIQAVAGNIKLALMNAEKDGSSGGRNSPELLDYLSALTGAKVGDVLGYDAQRMAELHTAAQQLNSRTNDRLGALSTKPFPPSVDAPMQTGGATEDAVGFKEKAK